MATQLDRSIRTWIADTGIAHGVIHGGPTETVETEGGPVRTLAKLIADGQAQIDEATEVVESLELDTGAANVGSVGGLSVQEALDTRGTKAFYAAPTGAGEVGSDTDGGTLQEVADNAKPMQSYAALRAYTGRADGVRITSQKIAGNFQRDPSDTTSADNGGTVIVDASGRRWKRMFVGVVNAFWFGAVGNNVVDDTAAINACFAWAASQKMTAALSPTTAGYKTTDTTTLPVGGDLEMMGSVIRYAGPKDRPGLVLGEAGKLNLRPVYRGIAIEQIGALSWPSMSHVGVRCINAIRGHIDIRYISSFTAPWECYSDTQGYSYNTHYIQELLNGKYQMVLRTVGPEVSGNFVNENTFIGGRYGCDSASNALGSRYGVLLTWDKTSSYRGHNANRWLYPCFELGNPSTGESVPMLFDGAGGHNRVVDARRESGIGPFARLDGGSNAYISVTNNIFSVIYGASLNAGFVRGIEEINGANGNEYEGDNVLKRDPVGWSSGKVVDLISGYGVNRPYIGGQLFFITNAFPTPAKWTDSSFIKAFKDEVYLVNGVGVGLVLDTSKVKRFNIAVAARTTRGRISFKCFDAAGQVLVPGSASNPFVMIPGNQLSTTTNYGGNCYANGTDGTTGDFSVTFADDVKKAWIIFGGGTNPLLLESILIQGFPEVQKVDGSFVYAPMIVSSGIPGSELQMFARSKPDTEAQHGVYKRGEARLNAVSAIGASPSWTAITNDVGYLNKPWVASTTYAYTGEIVINGSSAYVCVTAGTSAASGGPTGTGTAILDGTVVWDYLGPKAIFAASPNLV